MDRLAASVWSVDWEVEVCLLELDVDKRSGVDGHLGVCVHCNEAAGEFFKGSAVERIEKDPCASWHILEMDPSEMIGKLCSINVVQINLLNGTRALVD